jgi:hypothetical protein
MSYSQSITFLTAQSEPDAGIGSKDYIGMSSSQVGVAIGHLHVGMAYNFLGFLEG